MYLQYFGLVEPPFAITPDPRFVFLSARHEDALAHLRYGISQGGGGGFVQLTGEVGTGKTTLSRLLLSDLPEDTEAALVLNPLLEPKELLATICEELGIDVEDIGQSTKGLTDCLNRHLLDAHAAGRTVVAVIDEAQNLSPASLEQIRLLTNLETASQKLLQIILLGQPELRELLARADLRQLAQRITARFHLTPMNAEETAAYVAHRLQVAGASRNPFTGRALQGLHRVSGGVPRLVNIVADRSLLVAYADGRRTVEPRMIERAAREVSGEGEAKRRRWQLGPALAVGALVVAAVVSGSVWWSDRTPETASATVLEFPPGLPDAPDETTSASVSDDTAAAPPPAPAPLPVADRTVAFQMLVAERGLTAAAADAADCPWQIGPGVACLEQRGRLAEIATFGRPVLAALPAGWGLLEIMGDQVRWRAGRESRNVPIDTFESNWTGRYIDVWTMPGYVPGLLREGDRGPAVLWVKAAAAAAEDGYRGDVRDPYFGPTLARWVTGFQRLHGLTADGLIGRETLQRLSLRAPGVLP